MEHFNTYRLNNNFTTEDGIALINPTFKIDEFYLYCENDSFELVLHWIDENHNIKRLLSADSFLTPDFPTVEFIEGQLLQIPEFSASTIINT